jgi:hypothetical protein
LIPVLQAIVLAEHIYQTSDGRKIICGTFNQLVKQIVPHKVIVRDGETSKQAIPSGRNSVAPSLFVSLTNVVNETRITVQFASLKRNEVVFATDLDISTEDRLGTCEIIFQLPNLNSFIQEDVYVIEVVCEEEIIGSLRLNVVEKNE